MFAGRADGSTHFRHLASERLDFDFGTKLDDLIGGDPEELGRMRRNAGQSRIETLAPSRHSRARGRFDVGPSDKEGHLAGIKIEPRYIRTAKLARNIGRLRKAEMDLDQGSVRRLAARPRADVRDCAPASLL